MPKMSSKMYHCPGANGWVGDISPGGCTKKRVNGLFFCTKHEMPCRGGGMVWFHLKNQPSCPECQQKVQAQIRRERAEDARMKQDEKTREAEAFWKPGKAKKKP